MTNHTLLIYTGIAFCMYDNIIAMIRDLKFQFDLLTGLDLHVIMISLHIFVFNSKIPFPFYAQVPLIYRCVTSKPH